MPYKGMLGVGVEPSHFSYQASFHDDLIKNHYTSILQYSLGKNQLILGTNIFIEDQIKNTIKKCKMKPLHFLYDSLRCEIQEIIYKGKETYNINDNRAKVHFDVDFYQIYAPKFYYEILSELIFKKYIEQGKCTGGMVNSSVHCFYCENDVIFNDMRYESLYFMIDNWSIKYKLSELFKNHIFQIQLADWNNDWIFGRIYTDKTLVTVNADTKTIYFTN